MGVRMRHWKCSTCQGIVQTFVGEPLGGCMMPACRGLTFIECNVNGVILKEPRDQVCKSCGSQQPLSKIKEGECKECRKKQ